MSEVIPFKKPTKPQDLVLRFLNSLGHKRDAEFYLKLFTSVRPESFALIILDEEVLRDEMDSVLFEIRYLLRLSLFPVVLIRSSNDFLEKIEIESFFKKARIAMNFLSDHYTDSEKMEFIRERIDNQTIPLLHLDPDLNMVMEITRLAELLRTGKIIFLKRNGGLVDQNTQEMISIVNLRTDYDELVASNRLADSQLTLVKQCYQIVKNCQHKVFVSVVSPNNLMRELFTVKGAGTLVQMGSLIKVQNGLDSLDPSSLKKLLEMSFGSKVKDDLFQAPFDKIYLEENYMGAALVKDHNGLSYLSKFAVGTEARGLGIGRDLWRSLVQNHGKLFWRSNPSRFINNWYVKQCDGLQKTKDWTVYWIGLKPEEIAMAVEYSLSQPADFYPQDNL